MTTTNNTSAADRVGSARAAYWAAYMAGGSTGSTTLLAVEYRAAIAAWRASK